MLHVSASRRQNILYTYRWKTWTLTPKVNTKLNINSNYLFGTKINSDIFFSREKW